MTEFETGSVRANGIQFHYLEMGEGPLVLCLHGFPDHAYSYRYLLPELARAGFRAVAPFMRGYAPTEPATDGRYQPVLLAQDALAIVCALGYERAALVGHDWGAGAVTGAAVLEPGKVSKLVTIASAHPGAGDRTNFHFLKGAWHAYYFQLPQAEQTVAHDDFAFIEEWWRDASPAWEIPMELMESVKETFRKPGVLEAALAYYRHSFNPALQDPALGELEQRAKGPVTVPTLALHGTRDRPRRLEAFQEMDRFFTSELEKVIIPGAGHFIHQEKPAEVNARIVEFLGRS